MIRKTAVKGKSGATKEAPKQATNPHGVEDAADMKRAKTGMSSMDDFNLQPEYIKAADLLHMGPFAITAVYTRHSARFERDEIVFDIVLLSGKNRGAQGQLTLGSSPSRERLAAVVRSHAPVGPVILTQYDTDGPNPAYGFESYHGDDSTSESDDDDDVDLPF